MYFNRFGGIRQQIEVGIAQACRQYGTGFKGIRRSDGDTGILTAEYQSREGFNRSKSRCRCARAIDLRCDANSELAGRRADVTNSDDIVKTDVDQVVDYAGGVFEIGSPIQDLLNWL